MIKINNFRGDLSDVSARKTSLLMASKDCTSTKDVGTNCGKWQICKIYTFFDGCQYAFKVFTKYRNSLDK